MICWRRDRLLIPVFLGFPCGLAGKESACNAGDLGSILGLGRSSRGRERLPTPVFWPGEFHGHSPWGSKESDTTEQLLLLNVFCFCTISVLYCAHLCMKISLGISNFLEETSNLSHSIVFLYFFALIIEEGFLISPCYSLEL